MNDIVLNSVKYALISRGESVDSCSMCCRAVEDAPKACLQKVRYYGWMSRRQKDILQKLKLLLGDAPCDELLKKAAASRPFTCPKCGRPMQAVGVLPPVVNPGNREESSPPLAA